MQCPRCNIELTKQELRDFSNHEHVEVCRSCGGTWFGEGVLTRVTSVVEPVFFEVRHVPDKKTQNKEMLCPNCNNGKKLEKIHYLLMQ